MTFVLPEDPLPEEPADQEGAARSPDTDVAMSDRTLARVHAEFHQGLLPLSEAPTVAVVALPPVWCPACACPEYCSDCEHCAKCADAEYNTSEPPVIDLLKVREPCPNRRTT